MKIDADKIKQKVLRPKERKRDTVPLYLDLQVWEAFKKACEPASHGKVLEELMREFVESAKKK